MAGGFVAMDDAKAVMRRMVEMFATGIVEL
jgi:hypothetical protein